MYSIRYVPGSDGQNQKAQGAAGLGPGGVDEAVEPFAVGRAHAMKSLSSSGPVQPTSMVEPATAVAGAVIDAPGKGASNTRTISRGWSTMTKIGHLLDLLRGPVAGYAIGTAGQLQAGGIGGRRWWCPRPAASHLPEQPGR